MDPIQAQQKAEMEMSLFSGVCMLCFGLAAAGGLYAATVPPAAAPPPPWAPGL